MSTYENALNEGRKNLKEAGIEEYQVDGFLLMSELFGMSRTDYFMKQKNQMPDADFEKYVDAVKRRCTREPLQYITGHAYFMGYDYDVTPAVLIPRMDTECLVVEVEKILTDNWAEGVRNILDMCTGSGCIITSLVLRNERTKGIGADISGAALEVAGKNAEKHACENVKFVQSDLFKNIQGKYHIIVSNPPYIRTEVIKSLMEEVKTFEPYNALDGYEDGLHFYRKITAESVDYLEDGGYLCYEIGHDQGVDVIHIMQENGFKNCQVVKDLAGLDRVVIGKL